MQSNFPSNASNRRALETEFQDLIRQRDSERPSEEAHKSTSAHQESHSWLQRIGTALVNFLTGTQTLSIRQKALVNGAVQWVTYDPVTDTRQVFHSEQALRTWLEERYHR